MLDLKIIDHKRDACGSGGNYHLHINVARNKPNFTYRKLKLRGENVFDFGK